VEERPETQGADDEFDPDGRRTMTTHHSFLQAGDRARLRGAAVHRYRGDLAIAYEFRKAFDHLRHRLRGRRRSAEHVGWIVTDADPTRLCV
jgi:hypothetical protein